MARAQVNQVASSLLGSIVPFAGAAAPTGYLLCDGSAISRTTYSELFAVVSTTWGIGDGSTTFNVPDLRGRHLKGTGAPGDGNGGDAVNLGAFQDHATAKNGLGNSTSSISGTAAGQGGGATGTDSQNTSTTSDESGHTHSSGSATYNGRSGTSIGGSNPDVDYVNRGVIPATGGSSGHTHTYDHTHGVSAHTHNASAVTGTADAQVITGDSETRPKAYGVNYIIKT